MKMYSTGLGATELIGDYVDMKQSHTGALMRVRVKKPVVWKIRVYFQQRDLRKMLIYLLKPRNVWFIFKFLIKNMVFKKDSGALPDSSPEKT